MAISVSCSVLGESGAAVQKVPDPGTYEDIQTISSDGNPVYQGEVIAYSGRTGNAYDVNYAHLHLAIKKNYRFIDPEPYINGKLNTRGKDENKVVSSTNITNIKCH